MIFINPGFVSDPILNSLDKAASGSTKKVANDF